MDECVSIFQTDEQLDADLIEQLRGRARFCADRGKVKTPGLLSEAAARLTALIAERDRLRDEVARLEAELDGEDAPAGERYSVSLEKWTELSLTPPDARSKDDGERP